MLTNNEGLLLPILMYYSIWYAVLNPVPAVLGGVVYRAQHSDTGMTENCVGPWNQLLDCPAARRKISPDISSLRGEISPWETMGRYIKDFRTG